MNLLDTFVFMFESDTSKLEKGVNSGNEGAKKLKSTIDEVDAAALRSGESFLGLAQNIAKAGAALITLAGLKSIVQSTIDHTNAVGMQARAMGMGVEQLNAYQNAVTRMGGNSDQATATLTKLQQRFMEMHRFGSAMGPDAFMFARMGMSAKEMAESVKDPTVAILALSREFSKLNPTQQVFMKDKLGLDQGTFMLMQMGETRLKALIERQRELGVVTQQQAQAALQAKMAEADLGLSFDTLKREIITGAAPALILIINNIDKLVQFCREHQGLVVGFFGAIAAAAAIAAAPALLAFAPYLAIAAVIGLVVDDLMKFHEGSESVTGHILAKYPQIATLFKALKNTFVEMTKNTLTELHGLENFFMHELPDAIERAGAWLDKFMNKLGPLKDFYTWMNNWANAHGFSASNWFGKDNAEVGAVNQIADGLTSQAINDAKNPGGKKDIARGKYIADRLVNKWGWSRAGAEGMAGSVLQESNGNPTVVNPTSGAYGIAQWLAPDRIAAIEKYFGKPLKDLSLDEQIDAINYETSAKGKMHAVGSLIRHTDDRNYATQASGKWYEIAGKNEMDMDKRIAYANQIHDAVDKLQATVNQPLASTSSQAINAAAVAKNTISITAPATITTQSTDPKAIVKALADHAAGMVKDALDYHDNGQAL